MSGIRGEVLLWVLIILSWQGFGRVSYFLISRVKHKPTGFLISTVQGL